MELVEPKWDFHGRVERHGDFSLGRLYHHRYEAGQQTPTHTHDHDILYWVRSGASLDRRHRRLIEANHEELVFLAAGDSHATHWKTAGLLFHIQLSPGAIPAKSAHTRPLSTLRAKLVKLESELLHWDELSANVSTELISNLWQGGPGSSEAEPSWLKRVDEYLRDLGSAVFSLETAAQLADLHPTHLSRAYVQWRGMTLSDQARLNRLRRAAHRLRASSELSIGDIAAQEGFADQSHFTRQFRRAFGQSPSSYRNLLAR